MRKSIIGAFVALSAVVIAITGCTPEQTAMVAQQAGMASAVAWVSIDNPSDSQKAVASAVVVAIASNAASVTNGSYYATLSPVVNAYIAKNVKPQDQVVAELASGWALTGIDTFFAMNPKYLSDSDQALTFVKSYCVGAEFGLALTKDSPIMKAAMQAADKRSVLTKSLKK